MYSRTICLPAETTQAELLDHVSALNADPTIHGILVQMPLPKQINPDTVIRSLDPLSRETRVMQRHFFSGANDAELDKQGRVMIPSALLSSGGLTREVVVAGVYDHIEIWDRATWRTHLEEVEGSAEHVAERLAASRA